MFLPTASLRKMSDQITQAHVTDCPVKTRLSTCYFKGKWKDTRDPQKKNPKPVHTS